MICGGDMSIEKHCEILKKEFPDFKIYDEDNKFIIFDTNPTLFLRRDSGEYALRVVSKGDSYLHQGQVSLNLTQKDVNKMRQIVDKYIGDKK